MRSNNIQTSINPNFGTRYGRNLTNFIERNRDILTHDNFKNLSMIRNNGINSVLELEEASLKDKKLHHYKYMLNLKGGIIDKKNDAMRGYKRINYKFRNYITDETSGKPVANDDRFPIPIEVGKDSARLIAKQFDTNQLLVEKIEKEYEQSQIINNEFEKYKSKEV